jgi:pyruvate dehydrogenase phosphatase
VRNITPPYITAEPDIIHRRLDTSHSNATSGSNSHAPFTTTNGIPFTNKACRGINKQTPVNTNRFLILASDGFLDLCESEGQTRIIENWANSMVSRNPPESVTDSKPWSQQDNMALRLLRRTIGGEDRFGVSRVLTLEMDGAWIDDTSIVVQTL